jgi:hypothetical protein
MRPTRSRSRNHLTAVLRVPLAVALAFVSACGGSGGDSTTPVTPVISLALSQAAVTATAAAPATVNVTLTRSSGYTSDVTLGYNGLPAGVTASFNPLTLTGSGTASVITFTAGPTATAGVSTVTISAGGAGVSIVTTTLQLTVSVASININTSATATSAQGVAATVPITIERVGGFAGAVTLSAEGLPSGVTASFSPASIAAGATTSTLTLTPAMTALLATNAIVVRASGTGVADKTATISYTVTSPSASDYSISSSPAAIGVVAGASSSSTITLNRTGAFAGSVAFALSGNPAGVTATFTPTATTANTTALAIATTAATVPGTYSLTITGTATGLPDHTTTVSLTVTAPSGITVALSPASLSVAQGASAQTSVTVARVGGLTGDVILTAEGAPTGVTLTPLTITGTGTAGTATINAAASTVAGVYSIVLRGTSGAVSGTATLTLTVGAPQGISLAMVPASVSVVQGASGTTTANITRSGGFAGTVNLAVTGLPSNAVATVTPAAAAGASASISIAVASSVAVGTYTGTVTGTATGLTNATTTFSLVVTAPGGGGGGGNLVWAFCDATRIPLYFAVKDGASGTWTKLTAGANNTYTTSFTQSVGGVAYVLQNGTTITTDVYLQGVSELNAAGANECASFPAAGKTVSGSVTGFAPGETVAATLGNSSASASLAAPTLSWTNVQTGSIDLLAVKSAVDLNTFSFVPSKLILRRGLNPASGSTVPVLDFNGAEAVSPASAVATISGANGDTVSVFTLFATASGLSANIGIPSNNAATTRTFYGVPSASLAAGDLHVLLVSAGENGGTSMLRSVITYFHDVAARAIALGAALNMPTLTSSINTVLRPRAQGAIQSDYSSTYSVTFAQNTRNASVSATKAYFGAATNYDLEVPDLIASGYTASWGLIPGTSTSYSVVASNATGTPSDGVSYKIGAINGTLAQSAIRASKSSIRK